jgi:hypothetical protein
MIDRAGGELTAPHTTCNLTMSAILNNNQNFCSVSDDLYEMLIIFMPDLVFISPRSLSSDCRWYIVDCLQGDPIVFQEVFVFYVFSEEFLDF